MVTAAPESRTPADPGDFQFTGEQIVEGRTPKRIWDDHQGRYTFSVPFAVGRRVLDVACGTGYGSSRLAREGAREVTGVDINAEAIRFAEQRYLLEHLRYLQGDVTRLPLADGSIELVVCFETIEHVDDPEAALKELARVLIPRGILIISTPNRTVTSPTKGRLDPPDNAHHRVEYTEPEFDALLDPTFRVLSRLGQRQVPGILYNPVVMRFGRKVAAYGYAPKHGSPLPSPLSSGWQARYFVYVCQKR